MGFISLVLLSGQSLWYLKRYDIWKHVKDMIYENYWKKIQF